MAGKWLGMYMHMHWGYNHPYAARTWTLDDWRAYLGGLSNLGYSLIQIWPMVDTMPLPLTPSDEAHLRKIGRVIDLAHHEYGMTVWIVLSANAVGNALAGDYAFESRPYFTCERLLNPGDPVERRELIEKRRVFLAPLRKADGFSIIDGDPGGYEGSTVAEFVQLLGDHRALFDELRQGIRLNYWMWWGWRKSLSAIPSTPDESALAIREAVQGLVSLNPEPWGLLACNRRHADIVTGLGLEPRTLFYPYGALEAEPSVPWTNDNLEQIAAAFEAVPPESHPLGAMGNAQTHVFQLPGTYYLAQIAQGRAPEAVNLAEFADELIPGHGVGIAEAWRALAGMDAGRIEASREELLAAREAKPQAGRLGGLLLDDPSRFLDDLICQLAWKRAAAHLSRALDSDGDVLGPARALQAGLQDLMERTGFRDYYGGPLPQLVHPLLERLIPRLPNPAPLQAALDEYQELRKHHVPQRHGYLARLLEALRAALSSSGFGAQVCPPNIPAP